MAVSDALHVWPGAGRTANEVTSASTTPAMKANGSASEGDGVTFEGLGDGRA